jgi:transcription elongation factor GreA
MEQNAVFITKEGFKKLEEELQYLETERRAEVAARIQSAKEEGDISENAEYEDAKHEQAFVEGRIMTLRSMIRYAKIIEDNGPSDEVCLGSRVTVLEEGLDEPEVYHIVGSAEADPLNGRVSNESPIGQALLGQGVGDVVAFEAPAGEIKLEILGIE